MLVILAYSDEIPISWLYYIAIRLCYFIVFICLWLFWQLESASEITILTEFLSG